MHRSLDFNLFVQTKLVPGSRALKDYEDKTRAVQDFVTKNIPFNLKRNLTPQHKLMASFGDLSLDYKLLEKEISQPRESGRTTFEVLFDKAKELFPEFTDDDVKLYLQRIREENDGSFEGLTVDDAMIKFSTLKKKLGR